MVTELKSVTSQSLSSTHCKTLLKNKAYDQCIIVSLSISLPTLKIQLVSEVGSHKLKRNTSEFVAKSNHRICDYYKG
ncbi:hypothetical protein EAG_07649 [Camponotus floridanus]|uniref:Uncharacterized protein n=1 Tax=Camponotus floridanus TaxID=104421 RepID=E2AM56_CAMFO|nr:hypothetical protein EAG_07649 [Camponotus floridanus]